MSVPFGTAHLPSDRIAAVEDLDPTVAKAAPFVEEALRWLPDTGPPPPRTTPGPVGVTSDEGHRVLGTTGDRGRILLADDNADMREYVRRLLSDRYEVTAVGDGLTALEVAREEPPDLIRDRRDDAGPGRVRAASGAAGRRPHTGVAGPAALGTGGGGSPCRGAGGRGRRLPDQAVQRQGTPGSGRLAPGTCEASAGGGGAAGQRGATAEHLRADHGGHRPGRSGGAVRLRQPAILRDDRVFVGRVAGDHVRGRHSPRGPALEPGDVRGGSGRPQAPRHPRSDTSAGTARSSGCGRACRSSPTAGAGRSTCSAWHSTSPTASVPRRTFGRARRGGDSPWTRGTGDLEHRLGDRRPHDGRAVPHHLPRFSSPDRPGRGVRSHPPGRPGANPGERGGRR